MKKEKITAETTIPDIDNKLILMDIAAELEQIRKLLEEQRDQPQEQTSETILLCGGCGVKIPSEDREEHARKCFDWHTDMGTDVLDSVYEYANHNEN